MNTNLWASPHNPTWEQNDELSMQTKLVVLKDVAPELFKSISDISLDTNLSALAIELLDYCVSNGYNLIQPAGSPAFMVALGVANTLHKFNVEIVFAFSKRVSKDVTQPDGSVVKTSVFVHEGFVTV